MLNIYFVKHLLKTIVTEFFKLTIIKFQGAGPIESWKSHECEWFRNNSTVIFFFYQGYHLVNQLYFNA